MKGADAPLTCRSITAVVWDGRTCRRALLDVKRVDTMSVDGNSLALRSEKPIPSFSMKECA